MTVLATEHIILIRDIAIHWIHITDESIIHWKHKTITDYSITHWKDYTIAEESICTEKK